MKQQCCLQLRLQTTLTLNLHHNSTFTKKYCISILFVELSTGSRVLTEHRTCKKKSFMSVVLICYDGIEKLDPDSEIYMIKVYLDLNKIPFI